MKTPRPSTIRAGVRRWRTAPGSPPPLSAFGVDAHASLDDGAIVEGDAIYFIPRALVDQATPWGLVQLLPEPETLRGAMLVIAPTTGGAGFFTRVFGGGARTIPRALRGSALLLKGFSSIGGAFDPSSGLDLVWGRGG